MFFRTKHERINALLAKGAQRAEANRAVISVSPLDPRRCSSHVQPYCTKLQQGLVSLLEADANDEASSPCPQTFSVLHTEPGIHGNHFQKAATLQVSSSLVEYVYLFHALNGEVVMECGKFGPWRAKPHSREWEYASSKRLWETLGSAEMVPESPESIEISPWVWLAWDFNGHCFVTDLGEWAVPADIPLDTAPDNPEFEQCVLKTLRGPWWWFPRKWRCWELVDTIPSDFAAIMKRNFNADVVFIA
ncbi:MAG: hypothetical protein WDZ59_02275 [Pirellulales bacterium]